MAKKRKSKSFSEYWLNQELIDEYIPEEEKGNSNALFSIDLIQLSSYRKVIANFVSILTGKNIPVQFFTNGKDENMTDGKTVWLSSSIKKETDFDWSVGLALHEGSHILLSDFGIVKLIYNRIPPELKTKAKNKRLTNEDLSRLSKWIFNVVEDRYIDSFIFHDAPGYRGYYEAMYNRFWNSEIISEAIKSPMYRACNLLSYEFRVVNLTNPDTDLDCLPGLRDIANLMDLTNIFRLKTTSDRMELSFKICEIIIDNVDVDWKRKQTSSKKAANSTIEYVVSFFESDSDKPEKDDKEKESSGAVGKDKESEENADGDASPDDNNDDATDDLPDEGDTGELSDKEIDDIKKEFENQRKFTRHEFDGVKESISPENKAILEIIEKAGIVIVPTGRGIINADDYDKPSVDCIIVNKLTRSLIESGNGVFPMAAVEHAPGGVFKAPDEYTEAVNRGFVLGKLLGRKLQIRSEVNAEKYIRKMTGRIERRLLAGIGAGMEDIFSRIMVSKYNKIRLHISVDSSSSMQSPDKWIPTMTCLTTICVAASMVNNLAISVSFRCTHNAGMELPYIVLAYDSETDKISKVRELFPFLKAHGSTPEGLAFEATLDKFIIGKQSNEQDNYFVNISDGEPYYNLSFEVNKRGRSMSYTGEKGVAHTKRQVDKIRSAGVKILSYFIESENSGPSWHVARTVSTSGDNLKDQFQKMYGKDARYIDVTSVFEIAKTMNQLFLSKH